VSRDSLLQFTSPCVTPSLNFFIPEIRYLQLAWAFWHKFLSPSIEWSEQSHRAALSSAQKVDCGWKRTADRSYTIRIKTHSVKRILLDNLRSMKIRNLLWALIAVLVNQQPPALGFKSYTLSRDNSDRAELHAWTQPSNAQGL